MKRIECIIRPFKLDEVKIALGEIGVTPGGDELVKILERIGEMEGRELGSRLYAGWQERFPVFLVPGLLLSLLAWVWPARSAARVGLLIGLLLAGAPARADHVTRNNRALKAYGKGEFGAAAEGFGQSLAARATAQSHFNLGDALYRSGDLEGAAAQYRQVAGQAGSGADRELAARAWANLGRVLLDQQQLDAACQALEESLALKPDLPQARHNLELALRRQEQEQEQQEQSGDSKQDQKQDRKQDQQQDGKQDGKPEQKPGDSSPSQDGKPQPGEKQEQAGDSSASPPQRIDPAQLQQLLNSLEAQEREAQERQLKRLPGQGRKVEKDW